MTTIWRLYCQSGSYLPTPYPGRKPILTAEKWEEVKKLVTNTPDKTLDEIIEELELQIRKSRLSVLLIKEGYSFKKRQLTPLDKTDQMSKKNEKIFKK